jgi:hypothetical protein
MPAGKWVMRPNLARIAVHDQANTLPGAALTRADARPWCGPRQEVEPYTRIAAATGPRLRGTASQPARPRRPAGPPSGRPAEPANPARLSPGCNPAKRTHNPCRLALPAVWEWLNNYLADGVAAIAVKCSAQSY